MYEKAVSGSVLIRPSTRYLFPNKTTSVSVAKVYRHTATCLRLTDLVGARPEYAYISCMHALFIGAYVKASRVFTM